MPYKNIHATQTGFAHPLILAGVVITIIIITIVISANIKTTKEFSQSDTNVKGILIAKSGDDNENSSGSSGSSGSGSSGSGSSSSEGESAKKTDDSSSSNQSLTTKTETQSTTTDTGVSIKTQESAQKTKTVIKFSEGEKIKTRVEEDRTRIDVYSGGIKVRYEIRDGRVIIKAETEDNQQIPEQELFKIDEKLQKTGIKIATEGGKLFITKNNTGAVSSLPLQIDLNTNQLIASTSAGTRVLTTLPDQAIQNMLAANVISRLTTQELINQTQLGDINSVDDIVTLGERNGIPVYEIKGLKDQTLLGFIPITTQTTVFVSAETGQPVAQEQSLLADFIDLITL